MRFVVFYNDHPKVRDFSVRVWHLFQPHSNFRGEMTHFSFVKHYRLAPETVSSLGDVFYNKETKKWEIDEKRPIVSLKEDRVQKDKELVLKFMQSKYQNDEEMINFSLKEQELIERNRQASLLRKKDARTI